MSLGIKKGLPNGLRRMAAIRSLARGNKHFIYYDGYCNRKVTFIGEVPESFFHIRGGLKCRVDSTKQIVVVHYLCELTPTTAPAVKTVSAKRRIMAATKAKLKAAQEAEKERRKKLPKSFCYVCQAESPIYGISFEVVTGGESSYTCRECGEVYTVNYMGIPIRIKRGNI